MDRYRRRIAMLSVGAQLRCPVRRRIEGEIEIARPVEIVFETTRSHTPTRFFFSRVLQPFGVNRGYSCSASARSNAARVNPPPSRERRVPLGESWSPVTSTILYLLADPFLVDLGREMSHDKMEFS